MGLMEWVSEKLKVRDDLEVSDKSHIIEGMKEMMGKNRKGV